MTKSRDIDSLGRLEDFISLAQKGEKIKASISLKEMLAAQKVHPGNTDDMDTDVEMYILIGEFTFSLVGSEKKISKSYIFGSNESNTEKPLEKKIANQRLKKDYKRLKEAGIELKEILF